MNRWQAIAMRDAAQAAGKVAGINHEFRFYPARMHAVELVRRGAIGRPRRGEILGRYPIWARADSRPFTWLADAARGGGILGALGSHHTDCLRTFFGEPVTALASVRVDQPRRGADIATADDACTVHYEFEGGATAIIDLCASTPYRWERFEIHGEEGSLRWDETGYRLWRIDVGKAPRKCPSRRARALAARGRTRARGAVRRARRSPAPRHRQRRAAGTELRRRRGPGAVRAGRVPCLERRRRARRGGARAPRSDRRPAGPDDGVTSEFAAGFRGRGCPSRGWTLVERGGYTPGNRVVFARGSVGAVVATTP
jgi:predicted dehydrogenase